MLDRKAYKDYGCKKWVGDAGVQKIYAGKTHINSWKPFAQRAKKGLKNRPRGWGEAMAILIVDNDLTLIEGIRS